MKNIRTGTTTLLPGSRRVKRWAAYLSPWLALLGISSCTAVSCTATETSTCHGGVATMCPDIAVCGETCATRLPEGAQCSMDPCSATGTCGPGLACQGGSCLTAIPLGEPCSPTEGGICSSGLYCHNTALPSCGPVAPNPSECAFPAGIGEPCDSDIATYNWGANCIPCGAGLTCGPGSPDANGNVVRLCVKDCDGTAADCPCGAFCNIGGALGGKHCQTCANAPQEHCDDLNPCCSTASTAGLTCDHGACCLPPGGTCATTADCCGASSSAGSVACVAGVCTKQYPPESWVLCGAGCVSGKDSSDQVTHTITGHDTFSWGGVGQLDPVFEGDVPGNGHDIGSPQRLTWNPGWKNQEIIAFNTYYAGSMPNCESQGIEVTQGQSDCASPTDAFFPSSQGTPAMYSSLLGGTNESAPNPVTKDLQSLTTHIVYYDHGECRGSTQWTPIFDEISTSILNGLACVGMCPNITLYSATRDLDEFQPHFVSQLGDIRHGFEFDATYDLHLMYYIAQVFPQITVNPAYSFSVAADTGLLAVTPLNKGLVSVTNDTSGNSIHSAMVSALTTTVPQAIQDAIASKVTLVPPLIQASCDHTASLSTQQADCFQKYSDTSQGPSIAFTLLQLAFIQQGQSMADATKNANLAASALEKRNFVCQEATPGNGLAGDTCAVHPVFQRVNVLPDEIEFVFAETYQDDARNALYTAFSQFSGQQLCGQPITRCQTANEGCPIPLVQHGSLSKNTPDPGFTCGPCP